MVFLGPECRLEPGPDFIEGKSAAVPTADGVIDHPHVRGRPDERADRIERDGPDAAEQFSGRHRRPLSLDRGRWAG